MSDFIFSEHGEDIVIHRLLLWKENGYFVDCGAYHPRHMSLTARLRNFGWRGINIDIDRDVVDAFDVSLPGYTNVCAAVSDKKKEVKLYRYADPVLNTISAEQKEHLRKIEDAGELFTRQISSEFVVTTTLTDLLSKQGVENGMIDFLNLDIEGEELNALKGFPWEAQRPAVISIEIHKLDLPNCLAHPVVGYMYSKGYIIQSYIFHTAIFCLATFDTEFCHRVRASRL